MNEDSTKQGGGYRNKKGRLMEFESAEVIHPHSTNPLLTASSQKDLESRSEVEKEMLKQQIAQAILDLQEIIAYGRNPASGLAKKALKKLTE